MQGQVLEVSIVPAGDELDVAHVAGATTLQLTDVSEFDSEGGGSLRVDSIDGVADPVDYDYDTVDTTLNTVHILTGLVADAEEGRKVFTLPLSEEKWAMTEMQDDGDTKLVRVAHYLQDRMTDGIREPEDQETVVVEMVDGDLTIVNIIDETVQVDGGYIDPETLPATPSSGPTAEPIASPTLTTSGSKDAITVVAHGIIDPTTTLDYYLDGVLMESTRSTVMVFRTDSLGDPLVKDQAYLFHVIARNDIGEADPSPDVLGTLNLAVDSEAILAVVTAGFALLGSLDVGGISIRPPRGTPGTTGYDSGGIVIPLTTGGEIRFPADGSPAIIEAVLRTADLIVSGGLSINGITNYVNGTLFLGSGTPDPTTPTNISSNVRTKDRIFNAMGGGNKAGTGYEYHRGLARATNGRMAFTSSVAGSSAVKMLRIVDPTSNAVVAEVDSDTEQLDMRSVTAIGNKFYVLGQRWNGSTAQSEWRIQVYDTNGVNTNEGRWLEYPTGGRITGIDYWDGSIAADTDGTTLWVARSQSNGRVAFYRFTAADPVSDFKATESHVTSVVGITLTEGFYVGNGDFGAKRFALAGTYSGQYQIKVFNPTTWVEDTAQSWFEGWWAGGLIYDASTFKMLDYNNTDQQVWLNYARPYAATDAGNTIVAKHSWWDNNGTGGNKESAASPVSTVVLPKREWPYITVPPPPNTGDVDNPANSVRVYLGPTVAGLLLHTTFQPAAGQQIRSQTSFTAKVMVGAGPGAPLASTTFPVASSTGGVQSVNADTVGPYINLRGDGTFPNSRIKNLRHTVPHFRGYRSTALNVAHATWTKIPFNTELSSNQVTVTGSGMTWTVTRAGLYRAKAQARHDNGPTTTGRRHLSLMKNGVNVVEVALPGTTSTSFAAQLAVDKTLDLEVGDYVEIQFWHNAGAGTTVVVTAGEPDTFGELVYLGEKT